MSMLSMDKESYNSGKKAGLLTGFILHLHPRKVHEETLRVTLSFGLGGMAATLLFTLILSGILQLFSYSPHTSTAYLSVHHMYQNGGLAGFIRNIHYWSGNFLVIVAFLHLLRVLLTGALVEARQYNWLVGIILFSLVLFANFTGYLLPWDQLAYWASTIFTSMLSFIPLVGEHFSELVRGGVETGEETLVNFFALHVGIMPVAMIALAILHFWMIRKAGGLIRRKDVGDRSGDMVPVVPHLLAREAAVAFGLLLLVSFIAIFWDAPLGDEANPGQSPNPAKAAWYFMGLQELLLHLHPTLAICLVPLLTMVALLLLPFWKGAVLPPGQWFGGIRGARLAGISFLCGLSATLAAVAVDDIWLRQLGIGGNSVIWRGVCPLAAYVLVLVLGFQLLYRKGGFTKAMAAMAITLFLLSNIVGLTLIGIWLRGVEMTLRLSF